ncbi:hypothetical protein [Jannaschia rubra]|uniref:hypothetical protein n=1 Tax=Jannaschia rubra TaxID=282197 RepID=UPI000AEDA081|nr:hypothetical protein [Jannaschia rubra]
MLFPHYLNLAGEHVDTPVPEVPSDMQARRMARDRPGNARGLMNRTMRFATGLEDETGTPRAGLAARMRAVERSFLIETLMRHGGQRSRSAARNVLRQARPTWPATKGLPAGLTCPDSRTGDGERPCKKPHSMWFSHEDQAVDD